MSKPNEHCKIMQGLLSSRFCAISPSSCWTCTINRHQSKLEGVVGYGIQLKYAPTLVLDISGMVKEKETDDIQLTFASLFMDRDGFPLEVRYVAFSMH